MILLDTHVLVWYSLEPARLGSVASARLVQACRDTWLQQGLREIPLDGDLAMAAVELDGLHADPADRSIAATAHALGATLMTADAQLLGWQGQLQRLDASG